MPLLYLLNIRNHGPEVGESAFFLLREIPARRVGIQQHHERVFDAAELFAVACDVLQNFLFDRWGRGFAKVLTNPIWLPTGLNIHVHGKMD